MEDTHIIDTSFLVTELDGVNASLFAIFDGHSGPFVSKYLQENFPLVLRPLLQPFRFDNIEKALDEAFYRCNQQLQVEMLARKIERGGSTAVVLLLVENSFAFFANCGDSEAVGYASQKKICSKYVQQNTRKWSKRFDDAMPDDSQIYCASLKHRPHYDYEYCRVVNTGAFVYKKRLGGYLALSRSFGDFEYRSANTGQQIVIADPYIQSREVSVDDIIILGCDGLWDVCSYTDAVNEAKKWLLKTPSNVACALTLNAINICGSTDNVSVIILRIGKGFDNPSVITTPIIPFKCSSCCITYLPNCFSNRQKKMGNSKRCARCVSMSEQRKITNKTTKKR